MSADLDWAADLARCSARRPLLQEHSLWAIGLYRLGRRLDQRPHGLATTLLTRAYWPLFRLVETVTGVSLPKAARIGAGLRIWHFGGVFLHPQVSLGARCTLRQGVTIGNRIEGGAVPTLGDDVDVGAYAQLLGGIHIGSGSRIGAMAVVLCDVPEGATAVGAPARIVMSAVGQSRCARS